MKKRNIDTRAVHESFLGYRSKVYGWVAVVLTGAGFALYFSQDLSKGRNGGTFAGMTLGIVAALLIVLLTLLGIRKRRYQSGSGTVQGWLSAHVYVGMTLPIMALLHSGFKLQWNIHGAAYVLMCIVVASGLFGVFVYRRYPLMVSLNRQGVSRSRLMKEIEAIDRRCLSAAAPLGDEVLAAMRSAIDRTVLENSRSFWRKSGDQSKIELPAERGEIRPRLQSNVDQKALVAFLSRRLGESSGAGETIRLQELIDLCAARQREIEKVRSDIRWQELISGWLKIHIPVTFALLGALISHILSEFVYW